MNPYYGMIVYGYDCSYLAEDYAYSDYQAGYDAGRASGDATVSAYARKLRTALNERDEARAECQDAIDAADVYQQDAEECARVAFEIHRDLCDKCNELDAADRVIAQERARADAAKAELDGLYAALASMGVGVVAVKVGE